MNKESAKASSAADASVGRMHSEQAHASGFYTVECRGPDGRLKWADTIQNLVATGGKNDALDKYLTGSAYTATWFLGLISSTTFTAVAATDTMASHAGWLEAGAANAPTYSQTARPTTAWSAAAAGAKSLSASLTYSITGTGTVKGCFLTSVATKDGVTGILYSAGLFSGGDKVLANLDSLSVSYTASL